MTDLDLLASYASDLDRGALGPHAPICIREAVDEIKQLRAFIKKIAEEDHELHPGWRPLVEEAQRITNQQNADKT